MMFCYRHCKIEQVYLVPRGESQIVCQILRNTWDDNDNSYKQSEIIVVYFSPTKSELRLLYCTASVDEYIKKKNSRYKIH